MTLPLLPLITGVIGLIAAIVTLVGTILTTKPKKRILTIPSNPGKKPAEPIEIHDPWKVDYRRIKDDILEGIPVTCPQCGHHALAKKKTKIQLYNIIIVIVMLCCAGNSLFNTLHRTSKFALQV